MPAPVKRNRVTDPSPWHTEDEKLHALARACREGTPALQRHALKGEFMKPNPGELEEVKLGRGMDPGAKYEGLGADQAEGTYTVYQLRVERTCMPNPWADTIRNTARLPFRAEIDLEGWDVELMGVTHKAEDGTITSRDPGWVDDIDGDGRSLDQFAAEAFEQALFDGIAFAFVDQDSRQFPDPQSRRLAGARPYVSLLKREHVIRIVVERAPGKAPRALQVVIYQPIGEQNVEDPDNWTDSETGAYKVVTAGQELRDENNQLITTTPVTVAVYVDNGKGEYVRDPKMDGEIRPENPADVLTDVPLVPFYGNRIAPFRGHSPYLDTAHLQQAIFCHMSELLNLAREAVITYVHESGVGAAEGRTKTSTPVKKDTRGLRYRWSNHPNAKLTIVEQQGHALKNLRELVEWLVQQVKEAHHQISSDKPSAPVTAREITIEGVHANSDLEMRVIFQERAWQMMLELVALLGGHTARGVVSIPHDFGLPNTGMERNFQLFMAGKMAGVNYWPEAKRSGDVDERNFDLKAELELEKHLRTLESMGGSEEVLQALGLVGAPEVPGDESEE